MKTNQSEQNFDEMWEHNFQYCKDYEKKYSRDKINIKHMRFVNNEGKLEKIVWEYNMTTSIVKRKDNNGTLKKYPTYRCGFPAPLLDGRVEGNHIYLYEYFEQICVAFKEPPSNTTFIKLKLNTNKTKKTISETDSNQYKRITVPKKFWDVSEDSKCVVEYYPYKKDHLTHNYGLVTIDVITPQA